jgi:tRNA (guanine-N7-)-methyltransferase
MALAKLNSRVLAWPTDWAALFGREAPLILEIGFGRGVFLTHLAKTHPDANVVGLEISNRCLEAAERAVERERLTNIRVVHSMAETALAHLFKPSALAQVHVNFPDPWFKTRHSHRRLMQRDTLDMLVNRLAPGGLFYLATDIIEYAEMSAALLAATPGLDNLLPAPWTDSMPGRVVTKYEATARREGRDCYYFAYRRNDAPAPPAPSGEELPMPHLIFSSPLSLDEMAARFVPVKTRVGDANISLMEAYRSQRALLVEAFVGEPTIEQHIAVMIHRHAGGTDYTMELGTIGTPRSTPGIHRAVALLADWVTGLHPDARIVSQSIQRE